MKFLSLYVCVHVLTRTHNPVSVMTIRSYKKDKEKGRAFHLLPKKIGVAFSVLFLLLETATDCQYYCPKPVAAMEVLQCQDQEKALNLDLCRGRKFEATDATGCAGLEV